MIQRLVVNGCSYMEHYDLGGGTKDLAFKLNINQHISLAKRSCCNNRILRTTLRDIYSNDIPTLYILGMTFVNRYELTLLDKVSEDGCWTSFSGYPTIKKSPNFKDNVSLIDINNFAKIYVNLMNSKDLLEDLMYRLLCLIDCAKQRSHKILIFNTAEQIVDFCINESWYNLFHSKIEIIGGFEWRSIPWQFKQGASYPPEDYPLPEECRHVKSGDHQWLNEFLTCYINERNILQ